MNKLGMKTEDKPNIQLTDTPPSKPSSPVAPSQSVTEGLEGVAKAYANPSLKPVSASSSSSRASNSAAVNTVATSMINTQTLEEALKEVDTAITKEISITAVFLRKVLQLKNDKAQIEAFMLNPFVRDAAIALHNFKAVQCESNDQLQKLALEASNPYMKFIRELEAKIAAHKKSLEGKFKTEDASAQKQVGDQITTSLAKHTKEIDKLKTIFIDDVVKNREALLYFGTNRSLARGAGANNTYYVPAEADKICAAVAKGKSIHHALSTSKAIVIQRKTGPNRFDGIGAMGGLIETTRRHFPAFDVDKFNKQDVEFRKYLEDQCAEREKKLAEGKVPPHLVESTKHVIATANVLLEYCLGRNPEFQAEICACLDDVEFDADGNISINTNPIRSAQNAAEREGKEESGELEGLESLFNFLSASVDKKDKAKLLMGGDDILVDDNFFLSIRGISSGDTEAQAVSPVMLGSKCDDRPFWTFEDTLKEEGFSKFVSPMTHGEIAGLEVLSLNELRRRAGVSVDGKALSEEVTLKGEQYGKYAYRYVHEYAGTALKLSIMQLSEALKGDVAKLQRALIKMAEEDQEAVFTDLDDKGQKRNHKISLLSAAKIMFKKDLKEFEQENGPKDVDAMAYDILALELGVKGVLAEDLRAMDVAAAKVYVKYTLS